MPTRNRIFWTVICIAVGAGVAHFSPSAQAQGQGQAQAQVPASSDASPSSATVTAESALALSVALQTCLTSLLGLGEDTPAQRQSEALLKCGQSLETAGAYAQSLQTNLTATEKKKLLEICEKNMVLLENFIRRREVQPDPTPTLPTLSEATSVQNQLRLVLSALHALPNWSVEISGAAGAFRYLDGNTVPGAGGHFFVLLDHGNQFEAGLKFRILTPLREENELVEFPPREIDVLGVSQLWLTFTRYRNVNFKIGIFPDNDGYANPAEWPFVSVQGALKLISLPYFRWNARLRHDVLGTYSPVQETPRSTLVERTLWQNTLNFELPMQDFTLQARTHLALHWYTDPNGQVSSLSFGRGHYLDAAPASSDTRYRISETLFEGAVAFGSSFKFTGGYQNFHNFLLNSQNRGWLARVQPHYETSQGKFTLTLQRSVLHCASVPPLQVGGALLPGTASSGANLQAEIPFTQNFSAHLWASKYRSFVLLQDSPCSPLPASRLRSEILDSGFGTGVSYTFPAL